MQKQYKTKVSQKILEYIQENSERGFNASEIYAYLTKDGSHYPNVQGKLLRWNHWEVFPTFALQTLVRQPELKLDAHKEFLRLKQLIGDKNV